MNPFSTLPRKASVTIVTFGVLMLALPAVNDLLSKTLRPVPAKPVEAVVPRPVTPPPNLVIPPGSLDAFFAAIRKSEANSPGAVTRVLHYGDSPTTADSITADVRRLFQARFGDAGHGFVLIAKPWAWYGHAGVTLEGSGWKIEPASQDRAADGFHGLGGVSFRGGVGATSTVTLSTAHQRVTVYYVAQPEGGSFAVQAGETLLGEVHTEAPEKEPAFAEYELPEGTKEVRLRVTAGRARLFGYRFDKARAGVQYSSLGVNGGQIQMMLRYFSEAQWTAALRHENPDLFILNYGTNESVYPEYIGKQYPEDLRKVIQRIQKALPHASILVMAPMDRGVMEGGAIVTPAVLPQIVGIQRRIAAETGCAFFDTWTAMGGAGTMGRWYHEQPRLVSADFMHPLPQGAAKVGTLFEEALVKAYEGSRP